MSWGLRWYWWIVVLGTVVAVGGIVVLMSGGDGIEYCGAYLVPGDETAAAELVRCDAAAATAPQQWRAAVVAVALGCLVAASGLGVGLGHRLAARRSVLT